MRGRLSAACATVSTRFFSCYFHKRRKETGPLCTGFIWVISSHITNLPHHISNLSAITHVGEILSVPSIVTLNMEAVSCCHTVNHPPHYFVSQPTTPQCKCTRLLKLLQQNHVMSYYHRRVKLNILMDYSWKCWFICVHRMPVFRNPTPIKTL